MCTYVFEFNCDIGFSNTAEEDSSYCFNINSNITALFAALELVFNFFNLTYIVSYCARD